MQHSSEDYKLNSTVLFWVKLICISIKKNALIVLSLLSRTELVKLIRYRKITCLQNL